LFATPERCYDARSFTPPRRATMTKLLDRTRYAARGMPPVALASPPAGGSGCPAGCIANLPFAIAA
jgi:hypothetical protein